MDLLAPLSICVLSSGYGQSQSPFADHDAPVDPSRWGPQHTWHHAVLHKATAVAEVSRLVRQGYDIFVNLCDGGVDEDRAGIEVVQTLERLGAAFTGADSRTYDPSREVMKRVCFYAGVAVPGWRQTTQLADAPAIAAELGFPLLCKHPASYGSVGMTKDSKVDDLASLQTQMARFLNSYGEVLVERFVTGTEWTVLVAEPPVGSEQPLVLPAVQCAFPPGEDFKHFDLKWRDFEGLQWLPAQDAALANKVEQAAAALFSGLDQCGYGRVDLRVDEAGIPHVLEINPNCGLFYPDGQFGSADEILARSELGQVGFLDHILRTALRRAAARKPVCHVVWAGHGYQLQTVRAVSAGEVLLRGEQQPQPLATRTRALREWPADQQQWLPQYAWPLGDDLVATWHNNPEDWQPLDHSCAPTAWLHGLDSVARTDLPAGSQVTLDYATFCGPDMAAFACRCGAADCRGQVTGWDGLLPALQQRYAGHFSDWWQAVHAGRLQLPERHVPAAVPVVASDPDPTGEHMGIAIRVDADGSQHAVARRHLRAGSVVGPLLAREDAAGPARHTLQAGPGRHIWLWPAPLEFVDHSCAPNVAFDVDGGVVRVLHDVAPNEPLTFFYPATEWQMQSPFACLCGDAACLGQVSGAMFLTEADFAVPARRDLPIARHIRLLWAAHRGR
jgi:D-alanine-D-alanine ligase-like ATP-grasp enzyme